MDDKKDSSPNCNPETNKKGLNERVWILRLLRDILGNFSLITYIVITVIAGLLTYFWSSIDYCEVQKQELCGDILSFCSCVLGFAITGFSIVLTIESSAIDELSKSFDKPKKWWGKLLVTKSNAYDILCASFTLSCIFLLLTIITVILYKNCPNISLAPDWQFVTIQALTISSSLLVFDLLMHLYAVSTFLNKNHHKPKIRNYHPIHD